MCIRSHIHGSGRSSILASVPDTGYVLCRTRRCQLTLDDPAIVDVIEGLALARHLPGQVTRFSSRFLVLSRHIGLLAIQGSDQSRRSCEG